ncbi:MAG: ABC transporter permease DevC [Cyanobacteria bacterium P01_A01_bin.105]
MNPLKFLQALQDRTPLGFKQLKHDPVRLLTAIAGITFADILIFMQLGFSDALYRSNTQYPRKIQADIVLVNPQSDNFNTLKSIPRRRLYQAQDVLGVEDVNVMYVGSKEWRNPQTLEKSSLMVIGQELDRPAFDIPGVGEQLNAAQLPDHVLFDQKARGDYTDMIALVQAGELVSTEMGSRTVTVAGLFELGASFADDGALITSEQNFLRLFPRQSAGEVDIGLIWIDPTADPEQVRADLAAHLPEDVAVYTQTGFVDHAVAQIQGDSPIGVVFGVGSAMGFIVGVVIVYQVLSTDVNSHLAEYATFKAMGYRNGYLLGVVFEEALILSVLGFLPSILVAMGLYQLIVVAAALPMAMPVSRMVTVFVLTLIMCNGSGAIATRRLQAADPADIF